MYNYILFVVMVVSIEAQAYIPEYSVSDPKIDVRERIKITMGVPTIVCTQKEYWVQLIKALEAGGEPQAQKVVHKYYHDHDPDGRAKCVGMKTTFIIMEKYPDTRFVDSEGHDGMIVKIYVVEKGKEGEYFITAPLNIPVFMDELPPPPPAKKMSDDDPFNKRPAAAIRYQF